MAKRLDRLTPQNAKGNPFIKLWQKNCELIEGQFTDLAAQIAAIAAAQATANTAVTNAATAQTTADAVKRSDKISGSATAPSSVLTATDAGTNATITIANHTRLYGDATTLSVTGGSITALAYSTTYGVYYDDTTTANTAPTYSATTTLKNAMPNFAAGRHYMGQVTTPAAAGAPTGGGGVPPLGGGPYP